MNGGTKESAMNELWDELCCLCRLSISKDSRKRRGFMGPVVQRPRLHWLILQLVSQARLTPDVLAPISTIFSLVIPRVIRAYGLVLNDIKRLVLTAKNFHPDIFSG